jgi:hypothetical protein
MDLGGLWPDQDLIRVQGDVNRADADRRTGRQRAKKAQ